jgi:hypothetical protein
MPDVVTAALFPEWDEAAFMTADALKREAMNRVAQNAPVDWLSAAKHAGVLVAKRRIEFTTDPIWRILELQAVAAPHEPRAMGPVMDALMRAGVCMKTGRVVPSSRPECHRRPITVYKSLLYMGVQR